MNDDFNTPVALSILFQISHALNKTREPRLANTLRKLAAVLGLLQTSADFFLQASNKADKESIETMIRERIEARATKNWAKADEIRNHLLSMGIELEDTAENTTWRKRVD